MNGNVGKEKCIQDGKEILQHVGKTVTTLSCRPRYSRRVKKIKRKFTLFTVYFCHIYSVTHNKLKFSGS